MEREGPQDDLVQRLKQDFDRLCQTLGLQRFAYSLDLHDILKDMEKRRDIPSRGIEWLEKNKYYPVLALYCEQRFSRDGLDYHFNEISKWLRKAAKPEVAIKHAERSIKSPNLRVRAFGYTTGAAAYLDLRDLVKAEEWARHALKLEPADDHASQVLIRLRRVREASHAIR